MTTKQIQNSLYAPDGSYYVTLTDGAGVLSGILGGGSLSQITDPNGSIAAVKPISTAAVSTDPSLVVQLNPLSPGIITLGPAIPANSVPTVGAGFTFNHISTATTTTVKGSAGVLHTLTVNNLGTVASTTTVYDNTAGSGTVIAVINTLAGQISYIYDIAFNTGLTIVTTGTVAPDITVSYR